MSITTDNLAEFVDRLADLKRALAQLNDAGTADRHLIGLETVANAARALFDDDKQTTALRLFADPSNADMEPMLETGNGGYAYMDELAKYRIYGLHDMFNYQSATFICHDGELWRCVQKSPYERNAALAIKHKLVPVSGEMRIFDAADYRVHGKPWPAASTSLKAGGWQSPEDKQREAALLSRARVVHGSVRHQYGGKRPVPPSERSDEGGESGSEEDDDGDNYGACEQQGLPAKLQPAEGMKRARF